MKEETGYFTSFDGLPLFYRAWAKPSSTAVMLVHGFGEHSGRYEELVSSLQELPCSFLIHDLRGHGKSGGERVFVNRFDDFIQDLYDFRDFAEKKLVPGASRFILMGHSLGGLVAVHSALRAQNKWQDLILSSPFFGIYGPNQLALFLSKGLNRFIPHVVVNNPVDPVFLTHDSERVKLYTTDELIQRRITVGLTKEMLVAGAKALLMAGEVSIPLFVMTGSEEKIVSPSKIREFYGRTKSFRRELRVFDGFYHELFQEINRAAFFNALKQYLHFFISNV